MRLAVWKILKYKVKYFLKEVLLLYIWLQHDRSGEYKPRSSVPRHEIEAIVHTFIRRLRLSLNRKKASGSTRSGRLNGKNERKRKHLPNSRHNQSPCGQWTFYRPQGLLLFLRIEIRIFNRDKKSERLSHSESVRIIRMWSR